MRLRNSLGDSAFGLSVYLLFVFQFDYLDLVQCSVVTLETGGLVTRTLPRPYLFVILFVLEFNLKLSPLTLSSFNLLTNSWSEGDAELFLL